MKDLFRYLGGLIKKVFSRKETPSLLPDVSGCINFFWDSKTGDFNVLLDVGDTTEMSAEVLGMLMCYIDEGEINPFLIESLRYWCDQPDKMEFYTKVLQTWNITRELQRVDRMSAEDRPMVDPSDVFRLSKGDRNENSN